MVSLEKARASRFLATLTTCIDSIAIRTPMAFLDESQRFWLLIETLLGHPPIRGGLRPRDLPMGHSRESTMALHRMLAGAELRGQERDDRPRVLYSLHDWLVALAHVVVSDPEPLDQVTYGVMLVRCLDDLFHAVESQRRPTLRGAKKPHALTREAAAALGFGSDFEALVQRGDPKGAAAKRVDELGKLAGELVARAMAATLEAPVRIRPGKALEDRNYTRIQLKPVKVQSFIERCKVPALRRGASSWVSFCLGRIREAVLRMASAANAGIDCEPRAVLLIDSDAASVILTNNRELDESQVSRRIEEELAALVESDAGVDDTCLLPRLRDYRNAACAQGTSLTAPNPRFQAWVIRRMLHDVCNPLPKPPGAKEAPAPRYNPCTTGEACRGVLSERAFPNKELRVPRWYKHKRKNEGYGWAATVYSLAGLAARVASYRDMRRACKVEGPVLPVPQGSRDVERSWNSPGLTVKVDGDDVGKAMSSIPELALPAFSLGLEACLHDAFVSACRNVTAGEAVQKTPLARPFPVELLYFGGDDLLFQLPACLFEPFLTCFASALEENPPAWRWRGGPSRAAIRASIAAVGYSSLPPKDGSGGDVRTRGADVDYSVVVEVLKQAKNGKVGVANPPPPGMVVRELEASLGPGGVDVQALSVGQLHGYRVLLKRPPTPSS